MKVLDNLSEGARAELLGMAKAIVFVVVVAIVVATVVNQRTESRRNAAVDAFLSQLTTVSEQGEVTETPSQAIKRISEQVEGLNAFMMLPTGLTKKNEKGEAVPILMAEYLVMAKNDRVLQMQQEQQSAAGAKGQ